MGVRILVGDARAMLATLPDESVQAIVTSPPYYGLRSYLPGDHPDKGLEIGAEETPAAYVEAMVAVFREARRVLRKDGVAFVNVGDSYAGSFGSQGRQGGGGEMADRAVAANRRAGFQIGGRGRGAGRPKGAWGLKPKDRMLMPARLAIALQDDGWWVRSEIVWHKPNPMPSSVDDRPTDAHEMVYMLTKRPRYFYDAVAIAEQATMGTPGNVQPTKAGRSYEDGAREHRRSAGLHKMGARETRNARSVWTLATLPFPEAHFAVMTPTLAERCILAATSARGQCPHCGAPWERVTSTTRRHAGNPAKAGRPVAEIAASGKHAHVDEQKTLKAGVVTSVETLGWKPTCACPEHEPVAQTVLDPFGGAGTTGLVADRLRRDAVLVELNPDYAELARRRVESDAGLFADASVAAE